MHYILSLVASVLLAWGLTTLLPKPQASNGSKVRALRNFYGFEKTQQQAKLLGYNFDIKQYILLLTISTGAGIIIAVFFDNLFLVAVGATLGFLTPKIILSVIEYRRRREVLMNLPTNVRTFASKLLEFKSIETSLRHSIPLMTGITRPYFEHLYNSLVLRMDLEILLNDLNKKIRFQKFDDLCEKLISGTEDGFHEKAIDSIKETVEDMQKDIQLLKKLDVQNQNKIYMLYFVVAGIWSIPFLFTLFEMQAGVDHYTITTTLGKMILALMAVVTLVIILVKDKYLRLNLNKL